jgi:hypothetical protein
MKTPSAVFHVPGEPGTLGAVCREFFDEPGHEGCPFRQVCAIENISPKESIVAHIVRSVDADTLETMARAIRATMTEARKEAVL